MNINPIPISQIKESTNDSQILFTDKTLKNDASLPKFEQSNDNVVVLQQPVIISEEKATIALRNLLQRADITIGDLEEMPTKNIAIMAAALSMKSFNETADFSIKSLKIMTDSQAFIRDRQVKEFQDQLANQIKESSASNTGSIFSAIFDWIIGAVEVIVGAFKVVEGAARCAVGDMTGLVSIASGALYISAGVAGLVKAAAETAMLCGADKKTCEDVINVSSKVQLSCEMAGLATDIFQCGQAIMATRGIAKGAKEVVHHFAPAMGKAMASSSDEVLAVGQMIGKAVADEVSETVMKQLIKQSSQQAGVISEAIQSSSKNFVSLFRQGGVEYVGQATKSLTKKFSHDAIEEMVSKCALDVAKNATKSSATKTAEEMAQQITEAICKKIKYEVIENCVKGTTYVALEATRAGVTGAKGITMGSINIERSKLMSEISKNQINQFLLDMVFETYEDCKERTKKSIQNNYEKHGNVLTDISKILTDTASLSMAVASKLF